MTTEKQSMLQRSGRWIRVGILTLTIVAPIVNTLLAWLRQRRESISKRSAELEKTAHEVQAAALERLEDLREQGEELAGNHPFWTIVGFSLGLVVAAVLTYLFIRRRILEQEEEQGQHIELPQDQVRPAGVRPAGEIHHIDSNGTSVATLQASNVEPGQAVE